MITNLERDLTLVDRVFAALFGELERRQRLLRDAGNLDDIGSTAPGAGGPRLDPMPTSCSSWTSSGSCWPRGRTSGTSS